MKAKIDLDKFVCSLVKRYYEKIHIDPTTTRCWLDSVLKDQGLEYKDGEIVEIEQESKDERIRNIFRGWIYTRPASFFDNGISKEEMLAWLDKHDKPKKVSIWKHWKDGIAGGAEGEQVFLTKIGRIYSISSCLGCECDYIELSELDKL